MLCKEIMLLLYFLRYSLLRNIEQNKQVQNMYAMDIYVLLNNHKILF